MNNVIKFENGSYMKKLSWEWPVGKIIRHKTKSIDSVIIFAQKMSDMKTVKYGFIMFGGVEFQTLQEIQEEWEIQE